MFADPIGWLHTKTSGGVVSSVGAQTAFLATNSVTSSTSPTDAGLSFAVESGARYLYKFGGIYTTAATTTGIRIAVNGPSQGADGLLNLSLLGDLNTGASQLGAGTGGYDVLNQAPTSGPGGVFQPFWCEGTLHTAAAGTLALRFWSEVSGSDVTIWQGSYGLLWRIN